MQYKEETSNSKWKAEREHANFKRMKQPKTDESKRQADSVESTEDDMDSSDSATVYESFQNQSRLSQNRFAIVRIWQTLSSFAMDCDIIPDYRMDWLLY